MQKWQEYFESNKKLWNGKTPVHIKSDFYDLEAFKKGKNFLNAVELEEMGNVKGKSLLHLQCHFGQDTISWERHGANVTGVDFSEAGIIEAKRLASELDSNAEFICSNVYDLKNNLKNKFDIIFTSYGSIYWLPDLNIWADIISSFLKPGGFFYIVDFHNFLWMLDDKNMSEIVYPYFNYGPITEEVEGTYADPDSAVNGKETGWNHSMSEILNSLIFADLKIQFFNEFSFSSYNVFPGMVQIEKGKYVLKKFANKIPYMFSIKAIKN